MNNDTMKYFNEINKAIRDCEVLCFITRDTELQRKAIADIKSFEGLCKNIKDEAIFSGQEDLSNIMLGFECVIQCLCAELEMWISLKEGKPDQAWDKLVVAQMCAIDSVRAHRSFSHNEGHVARLEEIEKLIFPPQVFVSAGMIVRHQECSICGSEYGECDHLVGMPYWGEFCFIIAKDFELNHVAVVDSPADKRCRITGFYVDGGQRNRMTWKIEPREFEESHVFDYQPENEVPTDEYGLRATVSLIHSDIMTKRRK